MDNIYTTLESRVGKLVKIIDKNTQREITNPDLTLGYLSHCSNWASKDKYDTIDNITKFALDETDYEEVDLYIRYTEEDYLAMEQSRLQEIKEENIDSIPEMDAAICSLYEEYIELEENQDLITCELYETILNM